MGLVRGFVYLAVLGMLVCAGFGATASWGLLAHAVMSATTPTFSEGKLLIKAGLFGMLAAGSAWWLHKNKSNFVGSEPPAALIAGDRAGTTWLVVILLFVSLVSMNRLGYYPHIEPDESHHLIVARNLTEHGAYASGMPVTGLRWFDDYDSVGPTVIVPVAVGMWYQGTRIDSGRLVMAMFYVFLTLTVYILISTHFGKASGLWAAVLLLAAPGSIYLARTLYGEAPALAFLVAGAIAWGRALRGVQRTRWNIVSGALFGCALITKYFLVVAVWPAIGVWFFDRLTYRVIKPGNALIPAGVAVALLAGWLVVTSIFGPHGADTASAQIGVYQHNLLFGVGSLPRTLTWLAQNAVPGALFMAAGLTAMLFTATRITYSPPLLFLTLFGVLNAFWWIFFTTGSHPRYLWYSLALGAAFTGGLSFRGLFSIDQKPVKTVRWTWCALIIAMVAWDTTPRIIATMRRDEMSMEYHMMDFVHAQYGGRVVATTQYPVERLLNLCVHVPAKRVRMPAEAHGASMVIIDPVLDGDKWDAYKPIGKFGRYVLVETPK